MDKFILLDLDQFIVKMDHGYEVSSCNRRDIIFVPVEMRSQLLHAIDEDKALSNPATSPFHEFLDSDELLQTYNIVGEIIITEVIEHQTSYTVTESK